MKAETVRPTDTMSYWYHRFRVLDIAYASRFQVANREVKSEKRFLSSVLGFFIASDGAIETYYELVKCAHYFFHYNHIVTLLLVVVLLNSFPRWLVGIFHLFLEEDCCALRHIEF